MHPFRLLSMPIVLTLFIATVMASDSSSKSPSIDKIADRMLRVYQEAQYIHIEGRTVTSKDIELRYIYDGTPDSLRTICYKDNELLDAFSWHDGRVQEFVPRHPKRLLVEYDAERDCGIGQRVYPPAPELGCLYGMLTVTWIGSNIKAAECACPSVVTAQRIRDGEFRKFKTVNGGHKCFTIEWQQQWKNNDGKTIINTWHYYVDVEQYVIRRMDADYRALRNGKEIDSEQRRFIYDTMKLSSEPRQVNWDVWPLVRDHEPPDQARTRVEQQNEVLEKEGNSGSTAKSR